MSLVDDYKSGFKPACWTDAPLLPGAAWPCKIMLDTDDIAGLTFEIYARESPRSPYRLFDIPFTDTVEDSKVVLYPLAVNAETLKAFLNPQIEVTCQFTDDATGNIYPVVQGPVPVGVGPVPVAP